jgi:hypothetical protein
MDSKLVSSPSKSATTTKKNGRKEAFELGHVENAQISHELKRRENKINNNNNNKDNNNNNNNNNKSDS